MTELLPTIYICAFCTGPVYFSLSFILAHVVGHDFDGLDGDIPDNLDMGDDIDLDLGHDIDLDFGNDVDIDSPEINIQDIDAHEHQIINTFKFKYFSPIIWVAAITGFGAGGYLSIAILGKGGLTSILIASMSGLFIGFFLFSIKSYLNAHTSRNDPPLKIIGKKGMVTLAIPQNGIGLVKIDHYSDHQEFRATTNNNKRGLRKGEKVKVVRYVPERHLLIVQKTK